MTEITLCGGEQRGNRLPKVLLYALWIVVFLIPLSICWADDKDTIVSGHYTYRYIKVPSYFSNEKVIKDSEAIWYTGLIIIEKYGQEIYREFTSREPDCDGFPGIQKIQVLSKEKELSKVDNNTSELILFCGGYGVQGGLLRVYSKGNGFVASLDTGGASFTFKKNNNGDYILTTYNGFFVELTRYFYLTRYRLQYTDSGAAQFTSEMDAWMKKEAYERLNKHSKAYLKHKDLQDLISAVVASLQLGEHDVYKKLLKTASKNGDMQRLKRVIGRNVNLDFN